MPMILPKLTVTAPAKLNIHLAVLDRRKDGFHNIESVFFALNFGDTLHFELVSGENTAEITMEGLNFSLPVEKNIIFQALSLFRAKTGFPEGLKIMVEKSIPIGGGLGGGSSDAAAALLALNRLAGSPLSREVLLEMGASLGSDVPFFLYRTPAAWVTGRGERVTPIKAPFLYFVLVNPGFPSDTAAAFRLLDKYREGRNEFTTMSQTATLPQEPAEWTFSNDFLPVFEEREKSVYSGLISQLRELGADFAGLSGAGSTCFGVFKEQKCAEKAAASLRDKWNFVESCRSGVFSEER